MKSIYASRGSHLPRKTSKLAWHLLKFFRSWFLVQASWALFSSVFTFTPTLLLKVILEYVERPDDTPANAAWLYVVLLFVTGCIMALSDGQALWTGRKICVRLHSVIVGEVYAKALRRKVASGSDTVLGQGDAQATTTQEGFISRLKSCFRRKKSKPAQPVDSSPTDTKADTQANVGTIINLMAVDSFKVAEVSAYLHFLWATAPIEIILAVTLLYRVLGLSSVAGIGVMIILLPINIMIARGFSHFQKKIMAATDARIHITNEVLQNIRIIKFFAWEQRFAHIVDEKRQVELKYLRNRYILWSLAATIWYGAPLIIAFFTFFIYTVIEEKKLIPSVAFTALSLFSILRVPLDQLADMLAHVQESKVSVDRVEEFLNEEETEKYQQLKPIGSPDAETPIGLQHVTCTWGSRESVQKNENEAFTLSNVDVNFHRAELNIIAGPTGSGKTSLLMALLGEMTLLDGKVSLPGGFSREDLKPDPETGLIEAVAYCAQQAWLVNDTIRQNILFASPVDETRYKDVIRACALERDLEILHAGDQTQVGEKGIALSGGQKQRISLARALYSHTRHVLLDDCLSAVDSHTAKWIFDHCIMGPLMYNRTCILVTHNVGLCVPQSHYVIYLDNGRVTAQGPPEEVIASGVLGDDLQKSKPGSTANSRLHLRSQSKAPLAEDALKVLTANGTANGSANGAVANGKKPVDSGDAVDDPDRTEGVAVGRVKWSIIKLFLTAMGPWYYWIGALAIFAAQQLSSVATNVWIREWANSYHDIEVRSASDATPQPLTYLNKFHRLVTPGCIASGSCLWNVHLGSSGARFRASSTDDSRSEPNIAYYLTVYALLVMAYMIVSVTREGALFWGSLAASRRIHRRLVESLTRAKFSFFDSTPLGQIMNRFSKDVEAIDQEVAPIALSVLSCLASVITIVILISAITPGFLIAAVFITVVYISIGTFYIRSSRDLKRLESVQRSPLYQHFGETLTGITTIRAYGDERRFIRENLHRVNMHHRPFYFLWATNRWLAFRIDIAGALVSFFAGCFVVLNARNIDPGAAGLSLTYAVTFTENVLWLVRLYSVNEQNMNS